MGNIRLNSRTHSRSAHSPTPIKSASDGETGLASLDSPSIQDNSDQRHWNWHWSHGAWKWWGGGYGMTFAPTLCVGSRRGHCVGSEDQVRWVGAAREWGKQREKQRIREREREWGKHRERESEREREWEGQKRHERQREKDREWYLNRRQTLNWS